MLSRLRRFPALRRHSSTSSKVTREYGPIVLVVYSCIAVPTFFGCLYSVTYMGITQQDVRKVFIRIKTLIGFEPSTDILKEGDVKSTIDWLPEFAQTEQFTNFTTNVLIAMGMTKLFTPIKLALTAVLVPPLGRRLRALGYFLPKSK